MQLENRIIETKQKFEEKQSERDGYLKQADLCMQEMHRLQGEYRVLVELKDNQKPDKATTITATQAKEKK